MKRTEPTKLSHPMTGRLDALEHYELIDIFGGDNLATLSDNY